VEVHLRLYIVKHLSFELYGTEIKTLTLTPQPFDNKLFFIVEFFLFEVVMRRKWLMISIESIYFKNKRNSPGMDKNINGQNYAGL